MKDAINRLSEAIGIQNEEIQELTDKIDLLVPASELDKRLKSVEDRVLFRTVAFLGVAVLLAAVFAALVYYSSSASNNRIARETKTRAVRSCQDRNQLNQVLRDLVDRSATNNGNFDYSKLSATTKKILAEIIAAQPPSQDPQSFHSFVYQRTEQRDCSKL